MLVAGLIVGSAIPTTATARQHTVTMAKRFSIAGEIVLPAEGAATPYPATVRVPGLEEDRIVDVHLTLSGLGHPFPGGAEVMLVAPGGREAGVMGESA
jgi:hypothetical protein